MTLLPVVVRRTHVNGTNQMHSELGAYGTARSAPAQRSDGRRGGGVNGR